MTTEPPRVGFTCAYTPLALISAAGATPHRILPLTQAPEQAGRALHDNLCAHVKRVLDRALVGDIPPLSGVLFMNSCDAMRRLGEAWPEVRPDVPSLVVDLPMAKGPLAVEYLAAEIRRAARELSGWTGVPVTEQGLREKAALIDRLAAQDALLAERARLEARQGAYADLQALRLRMVTMPLEDALDLANKALEKGLPPAGLSLAPASTSAQDPAIASLAPAGAGHESVRRSGVPLFLHGNMLLDPRAISLVEVCGVRIVGDDLCTGSRQLAPCELPEAQDAFLALAEAILSRPPCARTVRAASAGAFEDAVVAAALSAGARGILAHAAKFCDPYLARIPRLRQACKTAEMPLLVLEGDCSLRTLGQQSTRIEAFVEMLE